MSEVAVLVPGIMACELRLDGQVVWPGPVRNFIWPYRMMTQLLDPALVATDVVIFKDRELRRTLGALLGQPGALGPVPFTFGSATIDVAVRDKVIEPEEYMRLTLSPDPGAAKFDGELRIEKADDPTREQPNFIPVGDPLQVRYDGPLAASLGLRVEAPG